MQEDMNPDIKKRWVEALRSGQYSQIRGKLHRENEGYCCLGVLTDLYLKEMGRSWNDPTEAGPLFIDEERLPREVCRWARIAEDLPSVLGENEWESWELAVMNDDGDSFEMIAHLIETRRVQ